MITVQEAHRIIQESIRPEARTCRLPLDQLTGWIIAEDLHAGFPMPRFTNAAMDGFAVIIDDISGTSESAPRCLTVSQEIAAGAQSTLQVVQGNCARIMTGAPMPEGADTVVPFEETSGLDGEIGGIVEFYKAPSQGANIRHIGEEVSAGELLIAKGTRITPAEIALIAAFGIDSAIVFRRPKVALITVGDELCRPGETAGELAIYNSNRAMLEACVQASGAELSSSRQLPDDPQLIREAIETALDQCDLLVTAGGISSGKYDYIREILIELGVTEKFWKVAQKPGKPLYFGTAPSGSPVFSLPGNPVSALVCFLEYCTPALCRLQEAEIPSKFEACIDEPYPADRKRHRFLFGNLRVDSATLHCSLSPKTESHMLTAASGANCLIESPAASGTLPAGSLVTCRLLPWATIS
ncbi:MAG: molybdopterin molybdotransferase MoeA [Chlorobiaceae bacterium]|nr:molybdopterin molybdotransferase MoeA [Chlorobiaceae bacterium]